METFAALQRGEAPASAPPQLALDVARVRTFDTPEFAGMTFLEVEAKTALNRVSGMPFAWSINPYRGCSHACSYCFARPTHAYLNLSPLGDFERTVVVKTNVVEVLGRELAKPSWGGEGVALGTNTDPYQRCEGRYRLMPGIIGALAQGRTPFSILTKGTLITRDLDVLRAAAEEVEVSAALTVGMLDEALWASSEPGTPSPRARLEAVRKLNEAGIPTGIMLAPIMPGLNDDPAQLSALIDHAVRAGATHVTPIVLHLRRGGRYPGGVGVRDVFWPWLEREHPELVERYARLYRTAQAPAAYRDEVTAFVQAEHRAARRRQGAGPARPALGRHRRPAEAQREAEPPSEQLRLL